ncbi:MAG: DoxX family protein [Actinomycetota bacterium]
MTDAVLLLLRVWLGVVFLAHGYHHARSLDGTTRWFASQGFGPARAFAAASAVGELAIGAGLAAGFLTSIAAGGVVAVAATAFWTIHRFAGFYVFRRPDEGWEYVATLAVAATAVAVLGPGRYSVDSALGWAGALDQGVGLGVIGGGVALAAVQLLVGWRRPPE